MAACVPYGYVLRARSQRLLKFEEQFPEAIDLLSRALRAGHALTTGLSMVAEEMPQPIGPEFQTLYDQQNFGLPLSQALRNFARAHSVARCTVLRDGCPDAEGGGRKPLRGARQPGSDHPRSVQGETAGAGSSPRTDASPDGCCRRCRRRSALFFCFLNPDKYATFYRDPLGMQMIAGALFLQLVGVSSSSRKS